MFVRCELTSHCSCSSLHPEDRLDCVSFYVFSSVQSLSLVRLCDPTFHECTVHFLSVALLISFYLFILVLVCPGCSSFVVHILQMSSPGVWLITF